MVTRNEAPALMAIHPGSILKEELIERGISQKDFAKMISMQPSHLSEIIKGKRSITKPVADKLEEVLGIPSIDWVNLQIGFEYDTQQNAERQIAEMAAYLNTLDTSVSAGEKGDASPGRVSTADTAGHGRTESRF